MKVNSITASGSYYRVNFPQSYSMNPINSQKAMNDVFIKSPEVANPHRQVSFMGYDVHIVDGGNHAINMEHFANAMRDDMDISVHKVQTHPKHKNVKLLQSLEAQLKNINDNNLTSKDSYIAIPVFATVPLYDLREEYKDATERFINLKPLTVKTYKPQVMSFLKKMYDNPEKYQVAIKNMDHIGQGIEYAYGVIREIDRLNCKKVFVPADLPVHETLKWKAKERNQEPELIKFSTTGYDKNNTIQNMMGECDYEECYNFNLLALSKAEVVNMKSIDGESDHIFAAYDASVTDGARGVYNFTPIREEGEIVGYSYVDSKKNQFPIDEFPHNEEVQQIQKFVGLDAVDVIADDIETRKFKQAIVQNKDLSSFSDKLYPVWKVFSEEVMREQKVDLRGDYIDSSLKRFYAINKDNKIVYPSCDCENSGRPSVMAMWGSCFSIFDAIRRDIRYQDIYDTTIKGKPLNIGLAIDGNLNAGRTCEREGRLGEAEYYYGMALEMVKIEGFDMKSPQALEPYESLANLKFKKGDYKGAEKLYNFVLNTKAKLLVLEQRGYGGERHNWHDEYVKLSKIFDKLAEICDKKGENHPARICRRASSELKTSGSGYAQQIIERRADGNIHIRDLF